MNEEIYNLDGERLDGPVSLAIRDCCNMIIAADGGFKKHIEILCNVITNIMIGWRVDPTQAASIMYLYLNDYRDHYGDLMEIQQKFRKKLDSSE